MFFLRPFYCCLRPPRSNKDEDDTCWSNSDRRKSKEASTSRRLAGNKRFWRFRKVLFPSTATAEATRKDLVSMALPSNLLQRNEERVRSHESSQRWKDVMVLGQGGFGKVTLIKNKSSKACLAVKEVQNASSVIKEEVIHGQLSHANIVELLFWKREGRTLHMYMKYCRRGSLSSKVYDMKKDEAENYFDQLTAGVTYLHSRGVTHRDIKPDNLLLGGKGTLKIADMGLSCLYISQGREISLNDNVGTVSYMAPEMLARKWYRGPAVDLWACGVVLFIMLTSARPWAQAVPWDPDFGPWMKQDKTLFGQGTWKELKRTSLGSLVFDLLALDPSRRLSTWRDHLKQPAQ